MRVRNYIFNTHPVVLHNPADNPLWEQVLEAVQSASFPQRRLRKLTVLCVDNQDPDSDSFNWARHSLNLHGADCTLLGGGLPTEGWSNRRKIDLYLKTLSVVKTPYVMGVDAYDAVFVAHPGLIVHKMRKHFPNASMVFGATIASYGLQISTDWEKCVFASEPYRHMNAGMWVATKSFCIEFFNTAKRLVPVVDSYVAGIKNPARRQEFMLSEQTVLKLAFALLYPRVALDHRCHMFQNIVDAKCVTDDKLDKQLLWKCRSNHRCFGDNQGLYVTSDLP